MTRPIKIAVLGSTGSIGRATLSLAQAFPDRLSVQALAAGSNVALLAEQIYSFGPALVSVADERARTKLLRLLAPHGSAKSPAPPFGGVGKIPAILIGEEGLSTVAADSGADAVVSAVVGAIGIIPAMAVLARGLKLCLANKESLVLGGEILMDLAGDHLAPVDSEHSAIFQVLGGKLSHPALDRLILTASGGPFRGQNLVDLKKVTRESALRHPTWSMGPKITCDSATMMNKGLEVIEAHHLFGLSYDQIDVLVHPGSHVHSLAGFKDGSILAQLGPADMRLAISYALSHPDRWPLLDQGETNNDFANFKAPAIPNNLTFEEPDRKVFKALALAEAAGRVGGTAPAILNAANEVAVEAFLSGRISFIGIVDLVENVLSVLPAPPLRSLHEALYADAQARKTAKRLMAKRQF